MAIAGRVAVVPKGEFSASLAYKRLDMVLYDGNGYIAKKETTGNLPTDTEYWMLSVQGLSGNAEKIIYVNTESGLTAENVQAAIDEMAKITGNAVFKTDIAKAPDPSDTDSPNGKLGISKPDGKTIKISPDGMLTGASTDVTWTLKELGENLKSGNYEEGMTVFVKVSDGSGGGGFLVKIDSEFSETSENALQNKIITAKMNQIDALTAQIQESLAQVQALRADLENYGLVKLSSSSAVTDSAGLAVPTSELNAATEGTLANRIETLKTDVNINKTTIENKCLKNFGWSNVAVPDHNLNNVKLRGMIDYAGETAVGAPGGYGMLLNFAGDGYMAQLFFDSRTNSMKFRAGNVSGLTNVSWVTCAKT